MSLGHAYNPYSDFAQLMILGEIFIKIKKNHA
jgi:hypothetical protein